MSTLNPFEELYVGEMIPPDEFVDLFSDVLLEHSRPMFQQGNVVVKGVYGSGKTMLLTLMKPEVRLAYAAKGRELPVPPELNKFVGAGISIGRSGALEFARYRHIDDELACELFGDFLNYRLADDVLQSITKLASSEFVSSSLGINAERPRLDAFAETVSTHRCWLGHMDGVSSFAELHQRIDDRIRSHQASLRARTAHSDELARTTTSIGEPLAVVAEELARSGVVAPDTRVYLRIDEYDKLTRLAQVPRGLGLRLRSVINAALSVRDPRVFYRIGSRPYGWRGETHSIFRSSDTLMQDRDYAVVDIDEILGRSEYEASRVFERFAEDVFVKRLNWCGFTSASLEGHEGKPVSLERVFGRTPSKAARAREYVHPSSTTRGISLQNDAPEGWRDFLFELAGTEPLDAKLGEAWLRQELNRGGSPQVPALTDSVPWHLPKWWSTNRSTVALLQLAACTRERLVWSGEADVLRLSGDHILAFLGICRNIWSVWSRSEALPERGEEYDFADIPELVQTVGINSASDSWFKRIPKMPHGDTRQLFIAELANALKRSMIADAWMAHPGYNGVSLTLADLSANPDVRRFLDDAADWGDLIQRDHSGLDRAQRRKYYIAPLLSPKFQLPVERRQEPRYVSAAQVRRLMHAERVNFDAPPPESSQLRLFAEEFEHDG